MNTQRGFNEVYVDKYSLNRSRIASNTSSNLKLGPKEDLLKSKNNNEAVFDLDPEWKTKHLSYTLKPKTAGYQDPKASFISREASSTCPTSIKSLEGASRQIKEVKKLDNLLSGFKTKHFQKSQKHISFNFETKSEHRRQTLYTPSIKIQQCSETKITDNKCFRYPSNFQPRTPQYSKNRQQTARYFDRYLESSKDNKHQDINFCKLSTFKSYYQNKNNNKAPDREHSFPNMKTVQSEAEEEQEELNSSIVITKCLLPSQLTFKEPTMFKSHLKAEIKRSYIEDLTLRRKTTGDIKEYLPITFTKN